jgi:DNA polymerase-3 subunit alpha
MPIPDNLHLEDEKVWLDIREDCTSIFQWEGTGEGYIKELFSDKTVANIRKANPKFSYLSLFSVGNGAIRPAGASYRNVLANGVFRDNGHKALNDMLSESLGYLVYQEQILEFLNRFCGYTMSEGDVIRRAIGKKLGTEQYMSGIEEGFIKTMNSEYGVDEMEARKIVQDFLQVILDASNYLFSKNHSDPYSIIGYACGYLRYYYPLEFLTVCLQTYKKEQDHIQKLVAYAKKRDIKVESPKFRKSKLE